MTRREDEETGVEKWRERFDADFVGLDVLVLLNERSASIREVAEGLDLPPEEVARRLDGMQESGLVEVVGEVLYRGKVEPRYRATEPVIWSEEESAAFSLAERGRLLAWVVRTVRADIDEALRSGTFAARDDAHASRTILRVDDQGWDELIRVHSEALDAVLAIQASSAERLEEARLEGISALSAVFCCELPPRAETAD